MFFGVPWVEWFGYAASLMVAVSLMMSSIVKLRWFNLVGATMFSTYGFIIGSLPVGFLNLFLADAWYRGALARRIGVGVEDEDVLQHPALGVRLPGIDGQAGERRVEDPGLHIDGSLVPGQLDHRLPEIVHAPGNAGQGSPQGQSSAQQAKDQRRWQQRAGNWTRAVLMC